MLQRGELGECARQFLGKKVAPAGGDDDPYQLSFRGLDNSIFYMLNLEEYHQLLNYSGCGNTVSGNHPVVKDLIITACKRYSPIPSSLLLKLGILLPLIQK
jgi:hypothetical protein